MTEETQNQTERSKKTKLPSGKSLILLIIFLGLVSFSAWSFQSYSQAKKEVLKLSTLEGRQELLDKELDSLLGDVRRHLILPEDEQPVVATISDIDALSKEQPFFEGASNGDKVIVYTTASKAIIYSPERDVIVNVGTVLVDNNEVELEDVVSEDNEAISDSDETSEE